jgi:uncharacterized protein (TIGR03000 family)
MTWFVTIGVVLAVGLASVQAQAPTPPTEPQTEPGAKPAPPAPPAPPADLKLDGPPAPVTKPAPLPAAPIFTPGKPAQPAPATTPAAPTNPPAAPAEQGKSAATIQIQVPANATIWFGEQKMTQTGATRTFKSPPLDPAKAYAYQVKVSWPTPGGKDYSTEHEITVRAGQTTIIDFTPLARTPATPPPVVGTPTSSDQPPRFSLPRIIRR